MKVAIAVMPDGSRIYPGPFGHSPAYAIYEKNGEVWRRLELRTNPHADFVGQGKRERMLALLADTELWVGTRFGNRHGPPVPHRTIQARTVEEALARLEAETATKEAGGGA